MAKIAFSEQAWQEYLYWQLQDKKTLKNGVDIRNLATCSLS